MRIISCVAALSLCLLGQGLGPAERQQILDRGAEYVKALNSSDPGAREQAILTVFSPQTLARIGATRLLSQMEALRQQAGRLELHHAELAEMQMGERTSRVLHVYARAASGPNWRDLQFRVDNAAPHKLTELAFVAEVAEPVYLPDGALEDPPMIEWLNGYITRLETETGLSGAVLIARGSTVLVERYFGFADAAKRQAIRRETLFGMASGSKMFTALAAALLVEQGKLSYDDPLAKYLPEWPDKAFARKVTVHHLLSHTSGIREYWNQEFHKVRHTIGDTAGLLPWITKAGVAFEPGTRAEYSNSNFALAGLIVEKASGRDFYDLVHASVLGKAGMSRSGFHARSERDPHRAEALVRSGTGWAAVAGSGRGRGTAAGGANTTAAEMLSFSRALVGGKIVRAETLKRMSSPQPGREATALQYGYGFELSASGGVRSFGHGGQAPGANFEFRYFPEQDVTLVLLSNQDNGAFDDLRKSMVKLITGDR